MRKKARERGCATGGFFRREAPPFGGALRTALSCTSLVQGRAGRGWTCDRRGRWAWRGVGQERGQCGPRATGPTPPTAPAHVRSGRPNGLTPPPDNAQTWAGPCGVRHWTHRPPGGGCRRRNACLFVFLRTVQGKTKRLKCGAGQRREVRQHLRRVDGERDWLALTGETGVGAGRGGGRGAMAERGELSDRAVTNARAARTCPLAPASLLRSPPPPSCPPPIPTPELGGGREQCVRACARACAERGTHLCVEGGGEGDRGRQAWGWVGESKAICEPRETLSFFFLWLSPLLSPRRVCRNVRATPSFGGCPGRGPREPHPPATCPVPRPLPPRDSLRH